MKYISILALICLASCMSKSKEEARPLYNEAFLKLFVLNMQTVNETSAIRQLDSIVNTASKDSTVFRQTIHYLIEPFSNPNSSYRIQNLCFRLLQAEINSKWFNTHEKEEAAGKLNLLQQNNIGNLANDFTYVTPAVYKKRMYDIKAKFLLLYFNNPECNACKEIKEALVASSIINQMLKTGDLKILSIYTDKDEKLWLNHLNEYPQSWIQGRDENENLYKNEVYELSAIPTIYLLDKGKKVLLKDGVNVREIERELLKYH